MEPLATSLEARSILCILLGGECSSMKRGGRRSSNDKQKFLMCTFFACDPVKIKLLPLENKLHQTRSNKVKYTQPLTLFKFIYGSWFPDDCTKRRRRGLRLWWLKVQVVRLHLQESENHQILIWNGPAAPWHMRVHMRIMRWHIRVHMSSHENY